MKTKKEKEITDVNYQSSLVSKSTWYSVHKIDYLNRSNPSSSSIFSSQSLSEAKKFVRDFIVSNPNYYDGTHGIYIAVDHRTMSCIHINPVFNE